MQQIESFSSWAALDVNTLTNLFLYGTRETPPDLNDRIRPHDSPEIVVRMTMNDVMSSGHGRYAKAALALFISDIFEGELDHLSGIYTVRSSDARESGDTTSLEGLFSSFSRYS